MSMITLAISYLTTSNLPLFMDPTFQVPMQYCSLMHQTLLLSPVTCTTGFCFFIGSMSSFFLQFFLHSSPIAYWAPTDLNSTGLKETGSKGLFTNNGITNSTSSSSPFFFIFINLFISAHAPPVFKIVLVTLLF